MSLYWTMYWKVNRRAATVLFCAKNKLFPNCITLQISILLAASIVSLKALCAFSLVSHTLSDSLLLQGDFIWFFCNPSLGGQMLDFSWLFLPYYFSIICQSRSHFCLMAKAWYLPGLLSICFIYLSIDLSLIYK